MASVAALLLGTVGFGAMVGRKALYNRAFDRCFYQASNSGKTPRDVGAWRWWPLGYDCAKPDAPPNFRTVG
jgi:hypothetical protein